MKFDIVTIFPHILDSYVNESILKRAREKSLVNVNFWNLRDFTEDKHRSVDDTPYGGGPGMVLKVEPIWRCLKQIKNSPAESVGKNQKPRIILMTPKGEQFDQKKAEELAKLDQLVLICGRYEGVDARVEKLVDEQVSIGPYVLSGGELPAIVVVEAVTRLLPGVLGSEDSLCVESFGANIDAGRDVKNLLDSSPNGIKSHFIEYPQYTRPEVFEPAPGIKWAVPKVLLSGNHKKIKEWHQKHIKSKYRFPPARE
ncbi:MAG: tRNA (guanosine(37)-N1)-methyltransferase TrmD [Patescibacteria group bacterium]